METDIVAFGLIECNIISSKRYVSVVFLYTIVYWLTAASRPRLSETKRKWFVFEASWYAFGGRYCIEFVASQK